MFLGDRRYKKTALCRHLGINFAQDLPFNNRINCMVRNTPRK